MSQQIFDAFTAAVKAKLSEASDRYDLPIDVSDVAIRYDIKGGVAGMAGRRSSRYYLRFNPEAVLKYNEDMTKDTIPHEVAHIVCQAMPHLGSGHDHGWKRVCRELGGDDSRTHDMILTPAKIVTRYDYKLPSGRTCNVGPKHHKAIQGGRTDYFMRNPKEFIKAEYWVDYNGFDVKAAKVSRPAQAPGLLIVRSNVPALPAGGSKREKAEALYKANRHLTRGEVINLFIQYADMTKAGASTYYQTFKSKNI